MGWVDGKVGTCWDQLGSSVCLVIYELEPAKYISYISGVGLGLRGGWGVK